MRRPVQSVLTPYLLALSAVAAALLVRWPLYPILEYRRPYLTLFAAVALAAWFGRWRAATLAAVVGFAAANYFLAEPGTAFAFDSFFVIEAAGYALSAGLIIGFGEVMHRARARAERYAEERRGAEETERRQKETLRVTFASIGDAVITTDAEGRVAFLNGVAESLTGWTQQDAAGQPLETVFRIVNEQTRDPVENPVTRALREGIIVGLANHTVLVAKDGTERLVDDSAAPIKDAQGQLLGCVLIFRDISARRKSEESLRESEHRLLLALEAGRMGTWEWKLATNAVAWSPGLEAIHGLAPGTFPGTFAAYQKDIHPEDREHVLRSVTQTLERGEDHHIEYRIIWPDGSLHWVEGRGKLSRDKSGKPERMIGVCIDISERKRAENQLRRAEEWTRSVVNNVVDGIITIDERAVVQFFNPAAEQLFGYAASEVIGQNIAMLMPEPYRREHDEYVGRYLRTGKAKIIGIGREVEGRRKDGSTFPMDLAVSEFRVGDSRHFTGIVRDITQRKQAEQALQDADRRKDEFLATLSHELRNPLAPIRNAIQVLLVKGPPDPELRWCREVIDRQVHHMTRLLDDLLDVSRITHNKLELRRERIELSEVLHSAVETSRPHLDRGVKELDVSLPPQALYLNADPVRLAQVFANLLNNAAKYTPAGGHIQLTCERQGSDAVVSVRDDGVGIAPEMLPRIFDLFSQASRALEGSQEGLGIGLNLVRGLVELHGGSVAARSQGPGRGSEFVVRLPLTVELAPRREAAPAGAADPGAGTRYHLLIADDLRDNADSLAILLQMLGHEVQTAYDGNAAIAAAERCKPAIVLLDIGMPGRNGYEVCRHIRQQPWGKGMYIVALTGWGQEDDRRRTQEAGFDHHLVKPVDPGELMTLLAAMPAAPDRMPHLA